MKHFLSIFLSIFILGLSVMFRVLCVPMLVIGIAGCPDNGVQPPTNPLQITVEDVTCTEIFLKISLATNEQNRSITLKRNDSLIATITMTGSDSLFVDEGLLPNKTYTYKLMLSEWTASAQVTTMDTTSHDWDWTLDTLGIAYSYLYDVAIVNDTLAFAVGEIYINDSTGHLDQQAYNAARWDGNKWELMRIQFYTICGQPNRTPYDASCVFAFSENDIWFGMNGDQIAKINGVTQTETMCLPVSFSIKKIWGANASDVYAVGHNGVEGIILHYNGSTWQKMESGTTVSLNDVWGGSNRWLGNDVVLVAASEKYTDEEKKLLRIKNGVVDSIHWPMQSRRIHSIWFGEHSSVFISGGGVFQSKKDGNWKEMSLPLIYTNRIRGNADNDIFVVGDFGFVGHYNGVNWQTYDDLKLPNGNYESVAITENLVIITGCYNGRGYIAVGKR